MKRKCNFTVQEINAVLPSVFDFPPPTYPLRIVVMTFEMISSDETHVIFSGNTKPFQPGFVEMKIKGQSVKRGPSDVYGEYFRVLPNKSLKENSDTATFLNKFLGKGVLKSSPLVIRAKPSFTVLINCYHW